MTNATQKEVEEILIETWKHFYSVAPNYVMHKSELDCCEEMANEVVTYINKRVREARIDMLQNHHEALEDALNDPDLFGAIAGISNAFKEVHAQLRKEEE